MTKHSSKGSWEFLKGDEEEDSRQRKVLLWEAPYCVNAIELEWLMSGGEKIIHRITHSLNEIY